MDVGEHIAREGLEMGAIRLNTDEPFIWASGFRMPIYNDNRMILFHPNFRRFIAEAFETILKLEEIPYDVIAGTSTAGISPATTLADRVQSPLIYVRDKPKDHGLRNQIEGIDSGSDLENKKIILIEDLISTGGSSVRAVQAIRNANGECSYCFSIFNYNLDKSRQMFLGREPYDDKSGEKLDSACGIRSLLNYDTLLRVAQETEYIDEDELSMLAEWKEDPFGWGEKHGFPRVER